MTLVPTQTAKLILTPTNATIPGRDEVLVPAFSADRTGSQRHALCARCCMLYNEHQDTAFRVSFLFVRPRSLSEPKIARTGCTSVHKPQAFFHMQNELESILTAYPSSLPGLGIPTLSSMTSPYPARSWGRLADPRAAVDSFSSPCSANTDVDAFDTSKVVNEIVLINYFTFLLQTTFCTISINVGSRAFHAPLLLSRTP